jgi:hypothetical protein
VLKDMRDTRRVGRVRFEPDTKDIILVVSGHMQVVRIRLVMSEENRGQVKFGKVFLFPYGEAMELLADSREGF